MNESMQPDKTMTLPLMKHAPECRRLGGLHVVVSHGHWLLVAQCLEVDIAVQGVDTAALCANLVQVLGGQIWIDYAAERVPFEQIGKAPDIFWEAYGTAKDYPHVASMTWRPRASLAFRLAEHYVEHASFRRTV